MLRSLFPVALVVIIAGTCRGMAEEGFGNEPRLDVLNYADWPNVLAVINDSHRVYQVWVNGNENFCFAGDTQALNAALKNLAAIKSQGLTVVLRPGPGKGNSLKKDRSFDYNWQLHLLGGIARSMSKEHLGANIWDPSPYLHVYVGGQIKLDDIEVPTGVTLLEIADLQTRYAKCLASADKGVRGWSCGHIASLDHYNHESMQKIAVMLDDKDNWVKDNAAGALVVFKCFADEAIDKLQAVKTDDKQLQKQVTKSIEELQAAKSDDKERKAFEESLTAIHAFVAKHRATQ